MAILILFYFTWFPFSRRTLAWFMERAGRYRSIIFSMGKPQRCKQLVTLCFSITSLYCSIGISLHRPWPSIFGPLLPSRHVEAGFSFSLFSPNVHIPDRFKDHLSDKKWNYHLEYLPALRIKATAHWHLLLPQFFFTLLILSIYPNDTIYPIDILYRCSF